MRKLEFKPELEQRDASDLLSTAEIFGHNCKSLSSKVTFEAAKQMASGVGLIGTVVVEDLRPTQPWVQEDKIDAYCENWNIAGQRVIDVILNTMNGKLYVWGGHHHVAACHKLGQKTMTAMVFNAHTNQLFDDPAEFDASNAAAADVASDN